MKARSALWPRMATGTTWWPVSTVSLTAARTASPSSSGPGWQKRCTTPQPTEGDTGSVMSPRLRGAGLLLAAAPPAGYARIGWRPPPALARPGRDHGEGPVGLGLRLVGL